jgi:hypothetical protein
VNRIVTLEEDDAVGIEVEDGAINSHEGMNGAIIHFAYGRLFL